MVPSMVYNLLGVINLTVLQARLLCTIMAGGSFIRLPLGFGCQRCFPRLNAGLDAL